MDTVVDVSYLADSVLLLRYFEAGGQVKQAISVVKNRSGDHERSIRELRIKNGIVVGEPLLGFRGILSGNPERDELQKLKPTKSRDGRKR
jgi:circadian clock protein KaiC